MAFSVIFITFPRPVPSVDGYVVHVDCDTSFVDEVVEYGVHHSLEGGRGVGQSEEHNHGFVEPLVRYEGCLPSVLRFDEDFVVSPFDVEACEQ